MRIVGVAVLLCLLQLSACSPGDEGNKNPIRIENGWLRTPPAGLDKTAGYFQLINNSGKDLTVTGATSEQIRAIEMHTTTVDGDMMRMRRLKTVSIPAGETTRFEPGGMHLMIFGLRTTQAVSITFQFEDGTVQTVPFVVSDSSPD